MVCVFSGQGAQFPGMGADLAAKDSEVMALFDRANEVLPFDLKRICFEGPAEELTKSNICQPAIFVTSVACYKAFIKKFPEARFSMAGGLSLGEWTALHVAGVLSFDDTLRVLEARGRLMQQACEAVKTGMISVMKASAEQVDEICRTCDLHKSNINSDAQVVLSGLIENIQRAEVKCKELGVRGIALSVAGAFHSPFMQSAREQMVNVLADVPFSPPLIPVLSNVLGKPHIPSPEAIRSNMLAQITESVLWCDCVKSAMAASEKRFIEFGPGKVLSGLIARIDRSNQVANVQDSATLEAIAL